jgi:hypothetical protein
MLITEQINHLINGGAKHKDIKAFTLDNYLNRSFSVNKKIDDYKPITHNDALKYLQEADSKTILQEFNRVKAFLFNNSTKLPCCPDYPDRATTAIDCIDVVTMLQVLDEV